jgi:hypothetical protein
MRSLPIPDGVSALHLFESDRDIKQHAAYIQAKAADMAAWCKMLLCSLMLDARNPCIQTR